MSEKGLKLGIDRPFVVKIEEKPNLIREICEFYGLQGASKLLPIYQTYPRIMVEAVVSTIDKIVNENYQLLKIESERTDLALGVYRFFANAEVPFAETNQNISTPLWEGYYFLTAKDKNNEKIVLYVNLFERNPFYIPCLIIWVPKGGTENALSFINLVNQGIRTLRKKIFSGNGRFLKLDRCYDWNDIILPEDKLEIIYINITKFLENSKIFQEKNVPYKRGLLLYGPPGNGKTLLGKILACQAKANFIWVTPNHFGHNQGVTSFADIFTFARKLSPTIVFLEDIDLIGGQDRSDRSFRETLCELLNQLDGFEENDGIITIATTNQIKVLDQALATRPGRFDISIEFPNPDKETRKKLFKRYCQDFILADDVDLEQLGESTNSLSCAYIAELVKRTAMFSMERNGDSSNGQLVLTKVDFEKALNFYGRRLENRIGFLFQGGNR